MIYRKKPVEIEAIWNANRQKLFYKIKIKEGFNE